MVEVHEIQKTLSQYCQYLDDQDVEKLGQLFTEGAQLVIAALGIDVTGRDQIRATYRQLVSPEVRGLHCLLNPVIDIEGTVATASVDNLWFNLTQAPQVGAAGRYQCILEKADGAWRIHQLRVIARGG